MRVIKEMYRVSRSAVLLDGECPRHSCVAQGCSLSYQWPFERVQARGGTK